MSRSFVSYEILKVVAIEKKKKERTFKFKYPPTCHTVFVKLKYIVVES